MKRALAAVAILIFPLGAGCSGASFVDEVTIVNDTEYSADVSVTDGPREGWLSLARVTQQSTKTVHEVIDQGEVWTFRFDYIDKHQEEVEMSRRELEENDWTVEVPESFEQRLRELDVPAPP